MKTKNKIHPDATKYKKLFDLCEAKGEGIFGRLHVIETEQATVRDEKSTFRIYHADGYCIDVSREPDYSNGEDEFNEWAVEGFEYSFASEIYDGFKSLTIDEAIKLLRA